MVSWNITGRCNLRCLHCYLDSSELNGGTKNELTREEGFGLIDQIAGLNPSTFLILSGGEPLLRTDFLDLVRHATGKLRVLVGTNGVLLEDGIARKMVQYGVRGVGISIDSITPERHDSFRGFDGAWEKAIRGIEACKRYGLDFQIQTTVTKKNYSEIPELIEFSHRIGAKAFSLFFLVCTGRGQKLTDISPSKYEKMLLYLVKTQRIYGDMMIRARCAPYFMRIAYQKRPFSSYASACYAGKNYCRITPDGEVTPCPYLPISVGNIRKESFVDLWGGADLFHQLRDPNLKGKCGYCEFNFVCGGCRARAFALTGDYMGADEWCSYKPKEKSKTTRFPCSMPITWNDDAEKRLEKVPFFIKDMVKREIECHAKEKGLKEITLEVMAEVRKKWAGRMR